MLVFAFKMRQSTQGWCTGMTQRDGMGRELGRGFTMGNTCKPMADSCECMAKPTTILCEKKSKYPSVQFSSVVSESLWSHESQYARPPCPSPTPRVHPNSCALSRWCHLAIPSSVSPSSIAPIPPRIRVFSNESNIHMRWPKYGSFSLSISPSNEWTL